MTSKNLPIGLTYDEEFCDLYESIYTMPHGRKLLSLEGIGKDQLDVNKMSRDYFSLKIADATVDTNANANAFRTPTNYAGEVAKGLFKLNGYYLVWRECKRLYGLDVANDLIKSIIDGDIYFHDSPNIDIPYCFATSLVHLLSTGRNWGQLHSTPCKRADSFISQVLETVMDMSQQFAGAIAMSDLLVCLSYFSKKENLDEFILRNLFQRLVHTLNNTFRVSGQSPFTNLSLMDSVCFHHLYDGYVFPDGSKPDLEEFKRVQKVYGDWFSKGDPTTGLPYRFPVTTANIYVDPKTNEVVDKEFLDWISEINCDKAFLNIYKTNDVAKLASCCRLINDLSKLNIETGFGNGGLNIGSHRVISINLARVSYKAKLEQTSHKGLYSCHHDILVATLDKISKLLHAHRSLLKRRIAQGYLTFFHIGWCNLDRMFFSTIGYNGIFEAVETLGMDPISSEGLDFAESLLKMMKRKSEEYSKYYGVPFNIEQIPAESAAVKFAQKDHLLYKDKGANYNIYSNQYVPLTKDISIVERMRIDGRLNGYLTGGGITHINIGEKLNNPQQMRKLFELAVKCGLEHFAVNYVFLTCEDGHVTRGKPDTSVCSVCGKAIKDRLTRVIGYWVPVSSWNAIREKEFYERKFKSPAVESNPPLKERVKELVEVV